MPSMIKISGLALGTALVAFCVVERMDPFYGIIAAFALFSWAPVLGRWLHPFKSVGYGRGWAFGVGSIVGLVVLIGNNPIMVTEDISHAGLKKTFIVGFLLVGFAGTIATMVVLRLKLGRAR